MTNTGNELTGLFQAQPVTRRGFPAFALSTIAHGVGIVMVSWALLHKPVIVQDPLTRNYKLRHLQLQVPETAASRAAEALYPGKVPAPQPERKQGIQPTADDAPQQTAQAEPRPRAVPALRLPDGGQGKQILVQPEIPAHSAMTEEAPLPTVLVWRPQVKKVDSIVPPAPEKPATVDAQPSFVVPNEELELADLPQNTANRPTILHTAPAGTSSPIPVKGPGDVKLAPTTVSTPNSPPTPAAVLSVSDLRMNMGTVALPPVNETRGATNKDGASAAQQSAASGQKSGGSPNGMGETAKSAGSATIAGGAVAHPGTTVADAQKAAQNEFAAGESAEHIQLPRDGKFSVVVVGTSLSDQYPETLEVWSDRVAYTAYLHVGTPKAWILQYAQPRSADAAGGGIVAHLDAPWPYDMERPNNVAKDLNADALMVHGLLNEAGRLVNLAIAYPQGYLHSSFVLRELQQWQFRPAQQNGKPTAVEVLLIIPEEND